MNKFKSVSAGEARALLGHEGFTEYIPVPLRSSQTTRNKIDKRFSVQTPAVRKPLIPKTMNMY